MCKRKVPLTMRKMKIAPQPTVMTPSLRIVNCCARQEACLDVHDEQPTPTSNAKSTSHGEHTGSDETAEGYEVSARLKRDRRSGHTITKLLSDEEPSQTLTKLLLDVPRREVVDDSGELYISYARRLEQAALTKTASVIPRKTRTTSSCSYVLTSAVIAEKVPQSMQAPQM